MPRRGWRGSCGEHGEGAWIGGIRRRNLVGSKIWFFWSSTGWVLCFYRLCSDRRLLKITTILLKPQREQRKIFLKFVDEKKHFIIFFSIFLWKLMRWIVNIIWKYILWKGFNSVWMLYFRKTIQPSQRTSLREAFKIPKSDLHWLFFKPPPSLQKSQIRLSSG